MHSSEKVTYFAVASCCRVGAFSFILVYFLVLGRWFRWLVDFRLLMSFGFVVGGGGGGGGIYFTLFSVLLLDVSRCCCFCHFIVRAHLFPVVCRF